MSFNFQISFQMALSYIHILLIFINVTIICGRFFYHYIILLFIFSYDSNIQYMTELKCIHLNGQYFIYNVHVPTGTLFRPVEQEREREKCFI